MDQKTVVHLHNWILFNREKEGAPTFLDSMDGTGEHYAKWNKPGGERKMPYDLTYKWNLINETNKQAKYNHRHWNKEQTDSNQRGAGRRIMRERKGTGMQKNMNTGPMSTDNGVDIDWKWDGTV